MSRAKEYLRNTAARIPLSAEIYQRYFSKGGISTYGYSLESLNGFLPSWAAAVEKVKENAKPTPSRRILVIGYLKWWLECATAVSLVLASQGHQVDLGFLPYRDWKTRVPPFDARRQRTYLLTIFSPIQNLINLHDLSASQSKGLPKELVPLINEQSRIDVQYSKMREDLDLHQDSPDAEFFQLRLERNQTAAGNTLRLLEETVYDTIVIPNGSILEFGAIYQTAKYLDANVVTYEFGEQRERIWLAQNDEVMRLDTTSLWKVEGENALSQKQEDELRDLYRARRGGRTWENFSRQWQTAESEEAREALSQLGIDPEKPVALLCTNVVGDSLALNRQIFTDGMVDWLKMTVNYFSDRLDAQLIIRVHPAELILAGNPSVEIVRDSFPDLPGNVVVIPPESKINTYDLIELSHLGLVYTTTVGMEMAMSGVPVISAGRSHYRGRGFTMDPSTSEEYMEAISRRLAEPLNKRLGENKVELAIRYAYLFFFEYPFRFPWHLLQFWEDMAERPLEQVIEPGEITLYDETLDALLGEPIVRERP